MKKNPANAGYATIHSWLTLLFTMAFLVQGSMASATAWVTAGPGLATNLSSWTNGTTSPATFTTPGDTWTINHAMTLPASLWTIGATSGPVSTLSLAPGGQLTGTPGSVLKLTVHGDLNLADTIAVNGAGARIEITINGNCAINSGSFIAEGNNVSALLTVNGNMTMNPGRVYVNGNNAYDTVIVRGNLMITGSSYMAAAGSGSWGRILMSLPSASGTMFLENTTAAPWQNHDVYVQSGCTARLTGNFTTTIGTTSNGLIINGTLIAPAGFSVVGLGIFTVSPGATLKVGSPYGLDGMCHVTGGHFFSGAADYEFNGASPQVTGAYFPASFDPGTVITINNPLGVSTFGFITQGTISFTQGILRTIGSGIIRMPCGPGHVSGTNPARYIDGQLSKYIAGCTNVFYETGDAAGYAPMEFNFSSPGVSGEVMVRPLAGLHPAFATSGLVAATALNHLWNITPVAATGPANVTLRAHYQAPAMLSGTNTLYVTQKYLAGWQPAPLPTTNSFTPLSSSPTAPVSLSFLQGSFVFGNVFCGTLPVTGTNTVCVGATTTLSCITPGGTWHSGSVGVASVGPGGIVYGIAAGTAEISYTAGGCTVISVVTVQPASSPGSITGPTTVCQGSSIALGTTLPDGTWSSSAPATGTISAGGVFSGISPGVTVVSYTVPGTCGPATAFMSITVETPPSVSTITATADTVCVGQSISMACATPGGVWSSHNPGISSVASGLVSGVAPGIDTVFYDVSNSCGTARAAKTVVVMPSGYCLPAYTGSVAAALHAFRIYPNPGHGQFKALYMGQETVTLTITDLSGRQLLTQPLKANIPTIINLIHPPGIYLVCITTASGKQYELLRIE